MLNWGRSAGHAACAGCHADDFAAARPRICGACHASTEPWRALVADRMPPATSDFGASLDHGRHRDIASSAHTSPPPPPLRRARTSPAPAAAVPRRGAAPALDACAARHRPAASARAPPSTAAPWSVRARFATTPTPPLPTTVPPP
jgi:hypothetical protein